MVDVDSHTHAFLLSSTASKAMHAPSPVQVGDQLLRRSGRDHEQAGRRLVQEPQARGVRRVEPRGPGEEHGFQADLPRKLFHGKAGDERVAPGGLEPAVQQPLQRL